MNRKLLATMALMMGSTTAMATCDEINAAATGKEQTIVAMIQGHSSGGYGLPMWWVVVDETGKICGVRNSSPNTGATIGNYFWLGSRNIAAQKANAANAFSLNVFSISTTNLYGLTLPGGSLYGLQASNPIDAGIAYLGTPETYGNPNADPLIGKRIGGINVFGGGLALYNAAGTKVGAVGVSGDTSCTDHAVAWQIRAIWGLDHVPGGFVSGYLPRPGFTVKGDEMVLKLDGNSTNVQNTFKQVSCANNQVANPSEGATTGIIYEGTAP
jgi:hypothetical protein